MEPTGEKLRRIYTRRFPEGERAAKARLWRVLVERRLQRWVRPADTVLDLGCGFGDFLNAVRCGRRIGVDLNDESPEHLADGIEFHQASIRDLSFLEEASVDLVFTSNVIEHLPDKEGVEETLRSAFDVLRPGGHLVALGPNVRLVPGSYWDFWDHHVPISDRSLVEILELIGFEIADRLPRFLPHTTCSRLPRSPALLRLYLAMPFVWPIFGKQFLIRARKPRAGG